MIAFKHSTVHHAPALWVVGQDGEGVRRLVGSMPAGVEPHRFSVPVPVRTRGAGEWQITGYLLTPSPLVPNRRSPAVKRLPAGNLFYRDCRKTSARKSRAATRH